MYPIDAFTGRSEERIYFVRSLKLPLWMYWQSHALLPLAVIHAEMGLLHSGRSTHLLQVMDYILPSPSNTTLVLPADFFEQGNKNMN